jgi:2-polyprenyl-3-methyl-5-hydroxy-6-metoxy-1,4-benzoquinol methylase
MRNLGSYRPYVDYECQIWDCPRCGCRFTDWDESAHERLHSSVASTYSIHEERGDLAAEYLRRGDVEGLRAFLATVAKNAFVMDVLDREPNAENVLEMGCSRGYLTAYFLRRGKRVLGVDSSETVIDAAVAQFGAHFCTPDAEEIAKRRPYDAIYHVGTIGCVESPIEMTRSLLEWLRPGGLLVFNAPNVNACKEKGELWVSTCPPDLVTLFEPGFWGQRFGDFAAVDTRVISERGVDLLLLHVKQLVGIPHASRSEASLASVSGKVGGRRSARRLSAALRHLLRRLPTHLALPRRSTEPGIHVLMRKNA